MSDMYITQAVGSRNYSLHWRDGHGTWAGNHSVSRHDIDAIWVCILLKMPAIIVRTGECMLFRPPKPDSNYVQVVAIVQRRHRFYK